MIDHECIILKDYAIVATSVADPIHFDMDPDHQNETDPNGSGSATLIEISETTGCLAHARKCLSLFSLYVSESLYAEVY